MRNIIVFGGEHHNSLGVIRSLGKAGLKKCIIYISVSQGETFVCHSKYLLKHNIFIASSEDNGISLIKELSVKMGEKPVIICCGDNYIAAVDKNFNELSKYCILPNAMNTQNRIFTYLNKETQCRLAERCNIKTPYHICFYKNGIKNIYNLPLPCIIKNVNSLGASGGKMDIQICSSYEEVLSYCSLSKESELIVEEYIDKSMEFQLIGCSLEQQIIIPGYTSIIRQPYNTNTGYLQYCPIQNQVISEELINKVKSFIREIGYKGLFSVEFIRNNNGDDYFLEMNMRNDGNAYCVTAAGINLPYIWYKYSAEAELKIIEPMQFNKAIYLMPEFNDIANIKKVGICKWIKEFLTADAHTILDLKDISPFLFVLRKKIKAKIYR